MSNFNVSKPDFLGDYEEFLMSRIRMYRSVLLSEVAIDIEELFFVCNQYSDTRRFRRIFILRQKLFGKYEACKAALREFHYLSNMAFMSPRF